MTTALAIFAAVCLLVLVAGGILAAMGFRDAPTDPETDGTTDNGTRSKE